MFTRPGERQGQAEHQEAAHDGGLLGLELGPGLPRWVAAYQSLQRTFAITEKITKVFG